VPVSCQATAGYFEATEITDMLCLLRVLDNPQRDIELAAVLRSPFFNISDTELAKIKLHGKKNQQNRNFYNHVLEYSNCGIDAKLSKKLKEMLIQLEQWRTLARRGNLADLIWQIYSQTHFLAFVSALPCGQARRANLLKLHDRAIQFEGFVTSSGIPSLTRFIGFIEKLQETGQDWAPAEPQSSVGNAVRILSVHKSKGLEFPVVFLAELNSRFNKEDIYADVLADVDCTLGLQVINRSSNSKLSSLAHQVIAEERLAKLLAEEMRILYVATTRAKDRLILTAYQKRNHCRDIIVNGLFAGDRSIPDWLLRSSHSHLDWILYALSDSKILHDGFGTGLGEKCRDDDLLSLKLYTKTEINELSDFVLKLKEDRRQNTEDRRSTTTPSVRVELLDQLKESLMWQYGFGDSPLLPAKLSVTQLTHRNDEYIKFDYSSVLERQIKYEQRATGNERRKEVGTAIHLVISQLDLTKPINEEAIKRAKEKLFTDAAITEDVAEAIDTNSILTFFHSELGRMALDKANAIFREWPFTFALPASHVARDQSLVARVMSHGSRVTDDEVVIIQGIIDMLIRTPKGLMVIDFKTDNITAKQVPQYAEFYREQLELYGRASSEILKEKLLAKWLYFLTPAIEFEIK
jgi:ATP-dependent helicase/nuclease subunit A